MSAFEYSPVQPPDARTESVTPGQSARPQRRQTGCICSIARLRRMSHRLKRRIGVLTWCTIQACTNLPARQCADQHSGVCTRTATTAFAVRQCCSQSTSGLRLLHSNLAAMVRRLSDKSIQMSSRGKSSQKPPQLSRTCCSSWDSPGRCAPAAGTGSTAAQDNPCWSARTGHTSSRALLCPPLCTPVPHDRCRRT